MKALQCSCSCSLLPSAIILVRLNSNSKKDEIDSNLRLPVLFTSEMDSKAIVLSEMANEHCIRQKNLKARLQRKSVPATENFFEALLGTVRLI